VPARVRQGSGEPFLHEASITRTHTHTHAQTRTRTHTHTHARARAHTHTHTQARLHAHIHARKARTHMHKHTHTHAHAHTNTGMHAHTRAHTHIHTHTQSFPRRLLQNSILCAMTSFPHKSSDTPIAEPFHIILPSIFRTSHEFRTRSSLKPSQVFFSICYQSALYFPYERLNG